MLVVPFYMLHVYDDVIATGSIETLIALTGIAIGLIAVFGVLDGIRGKILARAAIHLERRFARKLALRTIELPLRQAAAEEARLADLAVIRKFFAGPSVTAFFDAPLMPVYLFAATLLHPLFGGVAVLSALILGGLAVANDRLAVGPSQRGAESARRAHQWIDRGIRQADSIDALGMAARVLDRWQTRYYDMQSETLRASERSGALVAASRAFRLVAQIAILGTGAVLVVSHAVSPGAMVAATFIIARALAPMESAIAGWCQASSALAAWRRVKQAVSSPPRRVQGMALPALSGRIEVESATFTPPGMDRPALSALSFTLEAGRVLAVIGASGSGKSTLARLLVGIQAADDGHVRVDGADVLIWNRATLSPHIGYLPQTVELLGETVADAIARMGPMDPEAVVDAAKRAGAHDMILRLPRGYDTPLVDQGRNLSGGQRQWIGLVRAMYGRPRLVVLDEPDASLDGDGVRALLGAVGILRSESATVVLIGHSVRLAGQADFILVLNEGRKAGFGPRSSTPEIPRRTADLIQSSRAAPPAA
jgi:PrtD family type I secretion system ABC transporter